MKHKTRYFLLFSLLFLFSYLFAVDKCWSYDANFDLDIDVECLTKRPASISEPITRTGFTILHWAVENGQDDVVSILIDLGADVNTTDFFGMTPLHTAALNHKNIEPSRQNKIVEMLLRQGANPNMPNENGQSPIDLAQTSGNHFLARYILSWGESYGGAERLDDVIFSREHWERPKELVGLELLDIYNIRATDCYVYRDRGRWIDVGGMRYPFLVIYYNREMLTCDNEEYADIIRRVAHIYYYNLGKSDDRDISMLPITTEQKVSSDGTLFPARNDLNLILVEAKKAAFRDRGIITNEAEKDSITKMLADSVFVLMKDDAIDTRIVGNTFSKHLLSIIEADPKVFVNILLFHWKTELTRKYRIYKNERFPAVETFGEAQEKMRRLYEILDMNQMALAIERLRRFDPDRGFISELATDHFREAFRNAMQVALFREYGNEMGVSEISSAASYFIRLPLVEKTVLNFVMQHSPDQINTLKIENDDKEAIERKQIAICIAAGKFDSLIVEGKKPQRIERPIEVEDIDWGDSDVRPSKITVKLSPDRSREMSQDDLARVLQFSSQPPYVHSADDGIEVIVEFEPHDKHLATTLGDTYRASLDSLHPRYRPGEVDEVHTGMVVRPMHIDFGTVDAYKGNVSMQFSVHNNDVMERSISDIQLPKDLHLVSPIPPYSIPPKSHINVVLEFDPFEYSGQSVDKEFRIIFDGHESRFLTMEGIVEQSIRGIAVEPKRIDLGAINPFGGRVAMRVTVKNNNNHEVTLQTIGAANNVSILRPNLPAKIAPFSTLDIVLEFDPSSLAGKRVRKGLTLLFDNRERHTVEYTAQMQWATKNLRITPREIDFGELRADIGVITLVANVRNESNTTVRIVNVETPNYVWLDSPSLPHEIQPGGRVNVEVQLDPEKFAGMVVDNAFNIQFTNLPDEKVFFRGRVLEGVGIVGAEPSLVNLGRVEATGGRVAFRVRVMNNDNKERVIEGVGTGAAIRAVAPDFPVRLRPRASETLHLEFDPSGFMHNHQFEHDILVIMDARTRLSVPVIATILDTRSPAPQAPAPQEPADDELLRGVDLNGVKVLLYRDSSWDKVDLREPIGVVTNRGAMVSLSNADLRNNGIILTYAGGPGYDKAGIWITKMIMESVGKALPYADVKYVNEVDLDGHDVIIFLPRF